MTTLCWKNKIIVRHITFEEDTVMQTVSIYVKIASYFQDKRLEKMQIL